MTAELDGILSRMGAINGAQVVAKVSEITTLHKAGGGYISGAGTGTSDSIPAWLSNGEFVINAAQTAKHLPMLEAINSGAQGFARGGLAGFAGGGIVNGTIYTTDTGYLNALNRVTSALGKAVSSFMTSVFKSTATTSELTTAVQSLTAAAKAAGVSSSRLAEAAKLNSTLLNDATQRDNLRAKLGTNSTAGSTAYDMLNAAKSAYINEESTITQAIRSGFNIQTAGGVGPGGYASYAQTYAGQSQALSDATAFQRNLTKISGVFSKTKAGQELLAQLAEGGYTGSGAEAAALAGASVSQLQALVTQQQKLDQVAAGTGYGVARAVDYPQVVKDQAVVDELQHGISVLGGKIDGIGKQVASALNGVARTSSTYASTRPAGR